jgi:hypothetical protein
MPADHRCSRYRRIAAQYSAIDHWVGEGIRIECPRSRVKSALEHGLDPQGHRGKQTALEQDREQQILDWIKQNAEGSTSVTRKKSRITAHVNFKFQLLAAG